MEVDVTDERVIHLEECPSATGRVIVVVHTNPAELDNGMSVALDMAAIDVTLDSDEPKAASAVSTELDEGWTEKVNRIAVPEVHLDDLPAACNSRHHAPNLATASRRSMASDRVIRPRFSDMEHRGWRTLSGVPDASIVA
jgi:hypothetical protein